MLGPEQIGARTQRTSNCCDLFVGNSRPRCVDGVYGQNTTTVLCNCWPQRSGSRGWERERGAKTKYDFQHHRIPYASSPVNHGAGSPINSPRMHVRHVTCRGHLAHGYLASPKTSNNHCCEVLVYHTIPHHTATTKQSNNTTALAIAPRRIASHSKTKALLVS